MLKTVKWIRKKENICYSFVFYFFYIFIPINNINDWLGAQVGICADNKLMNLYLEN